MMIVLASLVASYFQNYRVTKHRQELSDSALTRTSRAEEQYD